jgi:hypothetical protein
MRNRKHLKLFLEVVLKDMLYKYIDEIYLTFNWNKQFFSSFEFDLLKLEEYFNYLMKKENSIFLTPKEKHDIKKMFDEELIIDDFLVKVSSIDSMKRFLVAA